jgi:NAD(P)-dependent dehydrogenase (short-subunit alcohol dehydrogenase family)
VSEWWSQRSGLEGTVAVVTGGAGGLGGAISRDLAANGVRVAVLDVDATAAAQLTDELGAAAIVRAGDVREHGQLEELFTAVDDQWGRVDTLVNVPGGTFRAPFVETRAKGWDTLLRTNLLHVLDACSLAVPRMQAGGRGGSIVNLTTIECHRAAPGFAVYSAAKAGVEQFGRTLAVELGPDRIRVNNVAPDYTPTPNMDAMRGDEDPALVAAGKRVSIPMQRGGLVEEVSACVVFLASALATYLTGSTLHVDGGTYASSGWFNWPDVGWSNSLPSAVTELVGNPTDRLPAGER